MKIKVITKFRDKFDSSILYNVGDMLDFESDRATNLISRHLAEAVEVPTATDPEIGEPAPTEDAPTAEDAPTTEEANLFTEEEVKPKRSRKTKSE